MVLSWHMRNGAAETERGFSIRKEVVADIWIVLTVLPELPTLFFRGLREREIPFLLIHIAGRMKGLRSVSVDASKRLG